MNYLLLKSLHIIFVVTWFAGLFYIVRLFIYHVESMEETNKDVREALHRQFSIMERRLWFGITWPSAIVTLICGFGLVHHLQGVIFEGWLQVKLGMVLLLFLYHLHCGKILKVIQNRAAAKISPEVKLIQGLSYTSTGLRLYNEIATLFLVAIVFLVIYKNVLSGVWAIVGFFALSVLLGGAVFIYRKKRKS
ncbi:CopD family protein [Bacteriovoracaceae bacterium]|nr:CopD family protein [Bacteriovoracaceae bacterium]